MRIVVLIHGAGGGGWEYDLWQPVFERAGYRFIARDLIPSAGGLEKTTFDDYVAQVKSWIPRGESPILIGASMGGILALKVAEEVKPAGIVLVNSVPPAGVPTARTPKDRYPAIVRWANGPLSETRDAMPDSDEATIQKAGKRWRDESGRVMNTLNDRVTVRKPACPVLVVIGTKDTDISPETSQNVADWANADIHQYRNMSHVGPLMSRRATDRRGQHYHMAQSHSLILSRSGRYGKIIYPDFALASQDNDQVGVFTARL